MEAAQNLEIELAAARPSERQIEGFKPGQEVLAQYQRRFMKGHLRLAAETTEDNSTFQIEAYIGDNGEPLRPPYHLPYSGLLDGSVQLFSIGSST